MKYITIPESIKLGNDGEKDVYHSFSQWVSNPLNGKPFGKDGSTLRMSCRLEVRFEGKVAGDVVPLSEEEWELLHESTENQGDAGFNTPVAKVFLPYMDAVAEATTDTKKASTEEPEAADSTPE